MTTGRINQVTISERTQARKQESRKADKRTSLKSKPSSLLHFCVYHDFTFVNVTLLNFQAEARSALRRYTLYYSGLAHSTHLLCGTKVQQINR